MDSMFSLLCRYYSHSLKFWTKQMNGQMHLLIYFANIASSHLSIFNLSNLDYNLSSLGCTMTPRWKTATERDLVKFKVWQCLLDMRDSVIFVWSNLVTTHSPHCCCHNTSRFRCCVLRSLCCLIIFIPMPWLLIGVTTKISR